MLFMLYGLYILYILHIQHRRGPRLLKSRGYITGATGRRTPTALPFRGLSQRNRLRSTAAPPVRFDPPPSEALHSPARL